MSLLNEVVSDMIIEETKRVFIDKVHAESGINKKSLSEAYDKGYKGTKSIANAKANVYSFVTENKVTRKKSKKVIESDITDDERHQFRYNGPFRIWDSKNKTWAGKAYKDRKRAQTRADRLDNEYGAYRFSVSHVDPKDHNKKLTPSERDRLNESHDESYTKILNLAKQDPKFKSFVLKHLDRYKSELNQIKPKTVYGMTLHKFNQNYADYLNDLGVTPEEVVSFLRDKAKNVINRDVM